MSNTSAPVQPVDGEAPTRGLSRDELFVRLKGWYQDDADHHREWVEGTALSPEDKGAREDFEFVAGRQWDDAALETLRKQNRPASVFDRCTPMVDAVCGNEVANRQEVRFIPRELGDTGVNEILTSAAQWFRDQSGAEDEESDAFRDAVISGKGWTETRIDFESNPDGDPVISRIDAMEIFADRDACKPNYVDARRIWRVRRMSRDEAAGLISDPEIDPSEYHAGWADYDDLSNSSGMPGRQTNDYDGDNPTSTRTDCCIVECQWWEREPFVRYVDGTTGQVQEMEEARFAKLVERMSAIPPEQMMMLGLMPPMSPVTQYRRVYRRAFIGRSILATPPLPIDGQFSYKAITGKRDRNRNQFFGLIRAMKDPQRWTNKLFSQIMHQINSNAKGGIFAEHGAFEDNRKAQEDYAKSDTIVWTQSGALQNGKIQPKPMAQFPQGFASMLEFAMGAMPLVTGINQEFLGMRDANQPGVLEYQRKQAGMTILATLFDSLRRYRKEQGGLMLRLIQKYLSDNRLVRIAGPGKDEYIKLTREATLGDYDVIVDDAPTAPNSKERNWSIIQQMMPLLMPMFPTNPQLAAQTFQNSPLPESLVQAIVESLAKPPPQNPDADLQRNMAFAKAIGDIQHQMAETESEQANALGRKARAMKDISDISAPYLFSDLPSPPMPMAPPLPPPPGMPQPFNPQGMRPMQPPQGPPQPQGLPPLGMPINR